ncbi:MAG: Glu/Leu/Phe/Val dehydrogenase [Dethiobacter sp.]|jgi:leucine dehydrogenase|nr:Glu/Leu/Phe/Val dehydrogenase [Dethiobacter sp.]
MEGKWFAYMEKYDYENILFCQEKETGIKAVIAIHDTTLGPAVGGCRMWTYKHEDDAIEDALRLAKGMTYKYAAAGSNLGGGKTVIIGDPYKDKSEALFRMIGRFINRLGGRYITGADVGTNMQDMEYIRMETPHIVTLPESCGGAGDIAPYTALGTFQGIKASVNELYGSDSLKGKSILVQGLGKVGGNLVRLLVEEGANVIISDIYEELVLKYQEEYKLDSVESEKVYGTACDVYAPCALGGVVNDDTINKFKCSIIAGAANNQLQEEKHAEMLQNKGILYAPDYILNAGGTIFDTDRLGVLGVHNQDRAVKNVLKIYDTAKQVFKIAKEDKITTAQAADVYAERRIAELKKLKNI